MYQALYRSFRPESFDTLLGQEHIVRILQNQIASGSTGHAYLFCGTRGTGKTTTARLLAKALNCTSEGVRPCGECETCKAIAAGNFLDVVEIDAASNNSVDDIRDLRESVNFPPVMGRTKVYIIDEAHMLSTQASNALLKTLEEPPENVVFILATTDPQKLPATILSRCLRMDFRRIPEEQLIRRFAEICMKLGVEATPEALALIAANADGSARDGLSLLDRCISGVKTLSRDDVLFLLGMAGVDTFLEMTGYIMDGDTGAALTCFAKVLSEGKEATQFARDWLEHLRNLIIIKYTSKPENVLNLSIENINRLRKQANLLEIDDLRFWITELSKALADAKWSPRPRILIELAIVRMVSGAVPVPAARTIPQQAAPQSAPKTDVSPAKPQPKIRKLETEGEPVMVASAAPAAAPKGKTADESSKASRPAPAPAPIMGRKVPVASVTPEIYGESETISESEMSELREAMKVTSVEALTEDDQNDALWNAVLHDASVPIQLQMSGAVFKSLDDHELVIQVSHPLFADRFEAHRAIIENLIAIRLGSPRRLKILC